MAPRFECGWYEARNREVSVGKRGGFETCDVADGVVDGVAEPVAVAVGVIACSYALAGPTQRQGQ